MFRRYSWMLALGAAALWSSIRAAERPLDTSAIESVVGLKGSYNPAENVFKISKSRTDVKTSVDGWPMPAFMGLTSWAAFTSAGNATMLMGDTVVFEDEVNAAMSAALDGGLEVTALHNHFFFDQPKVYFMHIAGMGDERRLASAVKAMYDRIAEVRAAHPVPSSSFPGQIPTPSNVSAAPIEQILGAKAQSKDGMVKVVVGRRAQMHGFAVASDMGVNTWAAFAGSDEQAVVDGDFAMREDELQTVLKAMRGDGINIVAIHQHMTGETPRYVFLHYWGKGRAVDLAKAVRRALDAQQPSQ